MDVRQERPWWLLPPKQVAPLWWPMLTLPLLVVEYLTGSYEHMPVLYVIPVCLAAFYSGRGPAVALALVTAGAHVAFTLANVPGVHLFTLIAASSLRCGVIIVIALWFARLSAHERALEEEVRTLEGLLPICSFCKSIRNDEGEWERLEQYVSHRSHAEFSHGICPPCVETHYAPTLRERHTAQARR